MARFQGSRGNKTDKIFDYKVFAVDTVEQQMLDDMSEQWYELDYAVQRPDKIYLIFRRYTNGY